VRLRAPLLARWLISKRGVLRCEHCDGLEPGQLHDAVPDCWEAAS
jgi:hypothetical protein